ncbi:MAG: hypothetical protein ACKO3W_03120 [bacterium]
MRSSALQRVLSPTKRVQRSLRALLSGIGLDQPRMSELRERFGFDKSVASRIARAVRSKDPASALRELPGTAMLERFVVRCEELGAEESTIAAARTAIAELDAAITAFPGDRTALVTALAGTPSGEGAREAPKVSRAKMRAARRGAYNALLFAQGICCESQTCITILAPSLEHGRADQAMVMATAGLRRMRPGNPYAILTLQGRPDTNSGYKRTTLAGMPVGDDPSVALIPEFCSTAASQLRLERSGRNHSLVLDPGVPRLEEPMDLAYGLVNTNFESCRAGTGNCWSMTSFTVARPTRMLLREVLLHRKTFGGCVPKCVFSVEAVPMNADSVGPDPSGRGVVDHGEELVAMGEGYARRGNDGEDFAVPLALRAMELLRYDPADFDRFRLVVEYPLPLVRGDMWLRLPE